MMMEMKMKMMMMMMMKMKMMMMMMTRVDIRLAGLDIFHGTICKMGFAKYFWNSCAFGLLMSSLVSEAG